MVLPVPFAMVNGERFASGIAKDKKINSGH